MTTVIFVTPLFDVDSPVRGFVARYVEALGGHFARVVVVAATVRGAPDPPGVEVVAVGGGGSALEIGPALTRVLAETGDATVVVVDEDLQCLAQVRQATGDLRTPVLWWCPQVPSTSAAAAAGRLADGLLVGGEPDAGSTEQRMWTLGAGIDFHDPAPTVLPPRPPLRLVALGRTARRKGLSVVLRAVAIARSKGSDTRLTIVGPSTTASEWLYREELEDLVKNTALTGVVEIHHSVAPHEVREILRDAHVLIDAGTGDDMSLAALEAMAAGRIVLSASARVAPMLGAVSLPLCFDAGDATGLADRIVALTESRAPDFSRVGSVLRLVAEQSHSLDHWLEQFTAAVDEIGRPVSTTANGAVADSSEEADRDA